MENKVLMMVGPTAIPKRVLEAMNRSSISHRSSEYCEIQQRVTASLKKIFNTKNDVFVVTASGTGSMESAIVNCFSPGEEVVVPIIGNFGKQYANMAERFGLKVVRVEFELGDTADVNKVMENVTDSTKGVLLVHNESSTGVYNDLKAFGEAIKNTNALFVVDSVSGLAGLEVNVDDWNIDIALTSSQKCLMTPAGISFVTLSPKAWDRVESSKFPKYYFDYKEMKKFNDLNQTPATPAVYSIFAADEAIKMIMEEGLENVYKRHRDNTKMLIEGLKELGFKIFPKDEKYASTSLTAVHVPGKSKYYVSELAKRGFIINGGLAPIAEDIFRVGIMGYVSKENVTAFLEALKEIPQI